MAFTTHHEIGLKVSEVYWQLALVDGSRGVRAATEVLLPPDFTQLVLKNSATMHR